ncbi:MAG: GspH/FimT family protein [Cyanobium sp.]
MPERRDPRHRGRWNRHAAAAAISSGVRRRQGKHYGSSGRSGSGLSLLELLLVTTLLGGMALLSLRQEASALARERLESATRRLALGLEQARSEASRQGRPCVLALGANGWRAPEQPFLAPCSVGDQAFGEGIDTGAIQLEHNLPEQVRFSSNGLVLDGGTVILSTAGTELVRCLVMSLPLGVVRLGRWQQQSCRVDPSL